MFEKGNVIINRTGEMAKVLLVIDDIFVHTLFLSSPTWASDSVKYSSFERAEVAGWKLKPNTTTKLSMDQIADKFGINVDNLEITKEE